MTCKLSAETIDSCPVKRPEPSTERPQNICLDKAYDNAFIREELRERGLTPHIRSRGEEVRELDREAGEKARRWVVERIFSWLNRYRGLLVRWSKKPENHDALLHFAMALITWQQLDLRALAPLPP